MPKLSGMYDVRYKTRNFSKDGVKHDNKLSSHRNHVDIPSVLIGSKEELQLQWDFLSIKRFIDTSFAKTGHSYENKGWEIVGKYESYDNYGNNVESQWDCWLSYPEGLKKYYHRIEDDEGNIITNEFSFPRIIKNCDNWTFSDGSSVNSGVSITFTGVVVGDSDFTHRVIVEPRNDSISGSIVDLGTGTQGSQYEADIWTTPSVSQFETIDVIYEVTWDDGQVQTHSIEFEISPPGP